MSQVPIIEYFKPLRAVITIRDKRNDPTYLFHDSFHPPEPESGSPAIYYCDVDLAYGQAGTFTLRINDQEHQLDDTKIGLGNKVWIQAGRDEDHLFNLFSGVCRTFKPIRQNYNLLGYEMSGFGTQIIMNERVVNYLRSSLKDPSSPNKPFVLDPNMTANKLFKVLMSATDIIPTGFPAVKHTLHAGMFNTEDQIDPIVDTFIASLTEPYVEASQVANSIADMAGAIWGVVPQAPGQPDKVFLRFPSLVHSGTIIKDKPDNPEEYTNRNVAYLRAQTGGFSFVDSMRKEDGFTNRIFSKTGADIATGSQSSATENATQIVGIDVAQQITVNSTKFRDIAFTLSVKGKGEEKPNNGGIWDPGTTKFKIVNDAGNRPGGTVELESEFEVVSLFESGEIKPIFLKLPQDHQLKILKPGDKAWVIFIQEAVAHWDADKEDECGIINPDFGVLWHHDGGNTGVSAIRTVCSTLEPFVRTPPSADTSTGWVVNTAGPTYSHTFFDSFSHIIEASDQESINKYGEVDSFIDFSFLTDENAMNQMLSSILQYSAKPRRIYEFAEVFIPYNTPIEPGSLVTVIDPVSGHNTNLQTAAEVQEVRYEFAADASGQTPLGTNTCEIRLLGYVDFRERHVLAISEQSIQGPISAPPPGSPPPPPPPPPPPAQLEMDTDGVKILYPRNNAQGKFHDNLVDHIGTSATSFNGDDVLEMDIEGNAVKTTAGGVTYWRCISREGSFASGGTNWTSRPEWVANQCSTPSGVSGAKSRGYLCNANDPKNVECTIIFRVDGIHDNSEEATMGIRGDDHSDGNEKCLQMKNFFPYGEETSDLWGFEKTHPDSMRRAVTFVSPYSSSNQPLVGENIWRGMKLVAWNVNNNQAVHCEMWIDESPIAAGGGYNNNWKKVWIYEEQRSDTPTWGGPRQQFRVDMCDELHLAAFSCHEIIPPGNATTADYTETDARSQTATPEVLAEKAEYEETTGYTHPDYIAEMVDVTITGEGIDTEVTKDPPSLRPANELDAITSGETGGILKPKIIARESHPIIAERDEVDATFGA